MNSASIHVRQHALRLAAEQAAGRWLAAHKAMKYQAGRTASLSLLVRQHPKRQDYRAAWEIARLDFLAAQQRAQWAYERYHQFSLRDDGFWTATQAGAA